MSNFANLLSLVFDFFWCSVVLLLSFLTTTSQSKYQMKSWLFLDIVIAQGTSIFQLFTSEDKTLLIWWDSYGYKKGSILVQSQNYKTPSIQSPVFLPITLRELIFAVFVDLGPNSKIKFPQNFSNAKKRPDNSQNGS